MAADARTLGVPDPVLMSLTAIAHSDGGEIRQEVLIDGRHHLVTDEPERLGGTDSGPAPHELLPAALAACIATTLAKYAQRKGWQLGELTVDVDYDNRGTPRRFDVNISFGAELDAEQLVRLETVASACPLRRSLETGFEFHERIRSGRVPAPARI